MENDRKPSGGDQEQPNEKPIAPAGREEHPAPKAAANKPGRRYEKKHPLEWGIFFLLFGTLIATGMAACYTRKQWITAEDQEVRSLRAYVAPKSFNFEQSAVRMEIENGGQTPANRVRHFSNWEARPIGKRDQLCREFSFPERAQCGPEDTFGSTPVLMPRAPILTGDLVCKEVRADGERAQRREIDWILYGHIDYADIFGKSRVSTYCYFVSPDGAAHCNCHNEIDPE